MVVLPLFLGILQGARRFVIFFVCLPSPYFNRLGKALLDKDVGFGD